MFNKTIKSIVVMVVLSLTAFVYAQDSQQLTIEEQIALFEKKREEVNQQIDAVDSMRKECVKTNDKFVKEANKALADERKQIRDHIKAINALLKDKPLPSTDKCDPDDPNCEDFCRVHKGVCYKGHCCS